MDLNLLIFLWHPGNYNGNWETTNCNKRLGYICKMSGGQNVKPTSAPGQIFPSCYKYPKCVPSICSITSNWKWNRACKKTCYLHLHLSPDSHCDQGYLLYGDFCYHFEAEEVKPWDDAEQYCVQQGGHLASVHTPEQVGFITGETSGQMILRPPVKPPPGHRLHVLLSNLSRYQLDLLINPHVLLEMIYLRSNLLRICWLYVWLLLHAAYMPSASWVGLNDKQNEGTFVWTDGTNAVSQSPAAGPH